MRRAIFFLAGVSFGLIPLYSEGMRNVMDLNRIDSFEYGGIKSIVIENAGSFDVQITGRSSSGSQSYY